MFLAGTTGNSMASDILFPRELIPTAQELLGLENEQSVREKIEGLSPTQKTDRLKLRAHQMKGIRFMWSILAEGPVGKVPAVGCILAHTMGLGKTCQAIIFLHLFMQEIGLSNDGCVKQMKRLRKRVLIAVPKSTRCSWVDQFEMWSNFFPPSQRIELLCLTETSSAESRVKLFKSWITHGGVLLTGYEMLTKVYKVYKEKSDNKFTTSEYIDLLICDEAHRLKCENLQVALTLKNLNPLRRLLITGTPLQNYLKEYWVMVDFALSKYFNKDQFHHYFTNPIESSANWRATQDEVTVARTKTAALIQELKNFVQCYDSSILKQELPPLQEYVVFVQLTQMQAELHDEFTRLARRCISASNFLQTIACLRKICTHPQMLFSTVFNTGSRGKESQRNESSSGDGDLAAAFERYEDVLTADEGYRNLCQPPPGYIPTPQDGSKVYVALLIVKEAMKRGERTLLFTMYNKLLDFLEVAIKHMNDVWLEDGSITTPIRFCRLDGTRTEADRSYALKTFASCDGPNVFLVSMRAGGVGLTITAATRVIIMDGGFNPAEEKQAIGRAYRYGQTQPVFAYHLICHGTFEHRVFEHKLAKEWLFRTIVEEASLKRDALKGFNFKTVYEVLESGGTLPLRSQKVTQSQAESTKAIAAEDEVLAKVIPHILYAEVHSTFLQQDDEFDLTASECPYQEEGGWNNSHGYNSLNGHSGCSEQQLFTSGCKRSFTQARVANLDNLVERIIVSRTDTDPQLAQALRAIGYIKSCESDPVDDVLRKGLNRIEGRFGGEDGLTSHEYRNINEINDEGNVEVTGNTSGRHKIPRTLLHRKP
ncbi:unnamed protein product [Trypanosoma congolense IL3000]|uniref:WGS project CAEQ00000000 data, annotated contig 802 n=1 Tax=Trypanosoma congolense (strain IL3000) TaxID=1068625 RepID=F9WIJ3_TRYCI|nr:unnamed protein product [Trypanosoma congolense IL3000]